VTLISDGCEHSSEAKLIRRQLIKQVVALNTNAPYYDEFDSITFVTFACSSQVKGV